MSLRLRILLVTALLALLPLLAFFLGARHYIFRRFEADYRERVELLGDNIDRALRQRGQEIAAALEAIAAEIASDNDLWLTLLDEQRRSAGGVYLRDYAEKRMTLAGLDMLQLLDDRGVVLSSGHFRQEHGQDCRRTADALRAAPDALAFGQVRRAEGFFPALLRAAPLRLGDREFLLVGGRELTGAFLRDLGGGSRLELALIYAAPERAAGDLPGFLATTDRADLAAFGGDDALLTRRDLSLKNLDGRGPGAAVELVFAYPRDELDRTLRDLGGWLGLVLGVALIAGLSLAAGLSLRISRPLGDLAAKAEQVDFDRLTVDFSSDRRDEVGKLSRLLQRMMVRLASGARRLQEAENRATLGEVARQVTHDIRNGFTPLRNVIAHLAQVAEESPGTMAEIFRERKGTLDSGLVYLEDLAGNYARISARGRPERCDLARIVGDLLPFGRVERGEDGERIVYALDLAPDLPPLLADPVDLRRILENLLRNARESMPRGGRIGIRGARRRNEFDEPVVLVEVEDEGSGIPPEELDRIFADFYTNKESGSGLGLSNVRRLIADLGGSVRVRSEVGRGSCFSLEFPIETPLDVDEDNTPEERRT